MMALFRLSAGLTCALAASSGILQQDRPVFRTTADQVFVDVSVRDGSRQVLGLGPADFELLDNGVVQSIVLSDMESQAVDVTVVAHRLALRRLTGPGSVSAGRMPSFGGRETLEEPIAHAIAEIEGLVRSDDNVEVVPSERPVQGQFGAIKAATVSSRATLLDDVTAALMRGPSAPGRRRLILVLAGAYEDQSAVPASARLAVARRADAVVHVIMMGQAIPAVDRIAITRERSPSGTQSNQLSIQGVGSRALAQLAETTGGRTFAGDSDTAIAAAVGPAVDEFRSRYLLRYSPTGVALPGWHQIQVRVKGGAFEVRHRSGYEVRK
jgi:hypothetical protein